MSARARIVGWMVLLVGLALAVSVMLSWRVLLARVDERVNAELAHEADKLRTFASSATDRQGRPYDDVAALLERYLRETLPEAEDEAYFSVVDGRPTHRSLGTAPARLDTDPVFIARVAGAREPAYGWADSPVGAVRYAVLPVQVAGDPRTGRWWCWSSGTSSGGRSPTQWASSPWSGSAPWPWPGWPAGCWPGGFWHRSGWSARPRSRIGESDLTRRIAVGGDDDVAQLARTFNHMLDRLEAAFAAQRRFLDDAGHELRTPITVIRGHLELMGDDPADRQDTTALVTDELERMSRIVDDLIVLAKAEQPDFLTLGVVDVADLTVGVVAKARAPGRRQWVVAEVAETTIVADGQRLTQALLQLAANAVQHTGDGDRVSFGSAVTGGRVRLWVSDTGAGIAPEDHERIFERFARGSEPRRSDGAGLGLAIVRTITKAHGGVVRLDSTPGRGATFTLELPERPPPAEPAAGEQRARVVPR